MHDMYLIHFSKTSLTNLGLGFSRSWVKQSALKTVTYFNATDILESLHVHNTQDHHKWLSYQSSQLHLNWKLLKWCENQLMSLKHRKIHHIRNIQMDHKTVNTLLQLKAKHLHTFKAKMLVLTTLKYTLDLKKIYVTFKCIRLTCRRQK